MQKKKFDFIFDEVLKDIEPSKKELDEIEINLNDFLDELNELIKKSGFEIEVFIGGSYAKRTLIRKGDYDIDIFLRFDKKIANDRISYITEKLLEKNWKIKKVHGSRDYFQVRIKDNLYFETIPVKKIKKPIEAENITDLSYSHVKYVRKKIKDKNLIKDIKLAKAFCHAKKCYGAESYINGFSGYGLELLVYNYGSFLKFINNIVKNKEEKIIIDTEKQHKNKNEIMININSSKLESPIILIDPTNKYRNVLAALSKETLEKFKKDCTKFLKNPRIKDFELEKIDFEKKRVFARKKKYDFIVIEARTNKQEGDVAGSKLLKFYNFISKEVEKFFNIKDKGFEYFEKDNCIFFFTAKRKDKIEMKGPKINDKKNVLKFKNKHKKTFKKKGRLYSTKKVDFNLKEFIDKIKKEDKAKNMYIEKLKIIGS